MNLFKNNSPSTILRSCPFDIQNLPHPQLHSIGNEITNTCCLSKLQVNCRVQCKKKKKKGYNSIYSSRSIISSSSQFSDNRKRKKKFSSSTNTNSHYNDEMSSSNSEVSFKHKKSMHDDDKILIQDLKTSIDNLTQLIVQNQNSSLIDKFRRFFTSSSKQSGDRIHEECDQILERNLLTKQKLLNIYQLFDKNETIFLNWLRTIMPESVLPLLLNYVKHLDNK